MMIKRLLVAVALAGATVVSLSSCSTIGKVQEIANKPVSLDDLKKDVFAIKSTYAGALRLGIVYLERPRCGQPTSPVLCSDPAVVAGMVKARTVGGASVESADTAVYSFGANPTVAETVVKAAKVSVDAFKIIAETYGAK